VGNLLLLLKRKGVLRQGASPPDATTDDGNVDVLGALVRFTVKPAIDCHETKLVKEPTSIIYIVAKIVGAD
jgi:hypothetical protein